MPMHHLAAVVVLHTSVIKGQSSTLCSKLIQLTKAAAILQPERITRGGLPAMEAVKAGANGGLETPRVSVQGPELNTPWSPSHVMAPETPRDDPMVQ